VFLSAKPLNIKIFCAIADHEEFRHKISEIVWDDARFARGPNTEIIHPERGLYLAITHTSDEETEKSFESRGLQGPPDWEFYERDFDYEDREDEKRAYPVSQPNNNGNPGANIVHFSLRPYVPTTLKISSSDDAGFI
jgi:hypothetical protein